MDVNVFKKYFYKILKWVYHKKREIVDALNWVNEL